MPDRTLGPPRPALAPTALTLALASALSGCLADGVEPTAAPDPTTPARPGEPEPSPGEGSWATLCVGCHGAFEGSAAISAGNANGDFRLDANAAVARHGDGLEAYIDATMPMAAAEACRGACAARTAAYIRGRVRGDAPLDCDDAPLAYGARTLKLLSSVEYQRSLEDLLGAPQDLAATVAHNDGARGGFVDMRGQDVDGAILDRYVRNAEAVAAWAVDAGRPFTCGDPGACADRFVDEFLFRAFRGPVSDAQRAAYAALFADYPADGMRLALEAALTSPYFLYRIEAGVPLETARARGYYTNVADAPAPPPSGGDGEVLDEILPHEIHGFGHLEGDAWALTQNGGLDLRFDVPFEDPAIVEIEAFGSDYAGAWPQMVLRISGQEIGRVTVGQREAQTYRFRVDGRTDAPNVRIELVNDDGTPPWGPGQDINLYLARLTLRREATAPPPDPDPPPMPDPSAPDPLEGVAEDAWVLTPYELAASLSFMVTGATPDDALLEAARADQLTTRAQITAQVTRLVDSPRGREHFARFVGEWFGLDDVLAAARPDVPEFTPEVKASMVREVQAHFLHVFYDASVPFSAFYGADYTFLNRTLAEFYGVPGSFDDRFVQTPVEGRGGPIASGAFMAANAHAERTAPILRAVRAREDALCHHIDPPNSPIAGDDIDAQRAAAQARVAEREATEGALSSRDFYFEYTDGIDACAGCHARIINPMFGMEDFDHVGRRRPSAGAGAVIETIRGVDRTVPLDGTLFGVASTADPATIQYQGAKDLSNRIAETEAVQSCLVRRGFRFATGLTFDDRDLDTAQREALTEDQRNSYACVAQRMTDAFTAGGQDPRAMFIELATERFVRLRR